MVPQEKIQALGPSEKKKASERNKSEKTAASSESKRHPFKKVDKDTCLFGKARDKKIKADKDICPFAKEDKDICPFKKEDKDASDALSTKQKAKRQRT